MNLETTPVFTKNYTSEKKIKVNRGGTRSSKTRSIAQLSVLWLMTGQISRTRKIPKGVWSTVRKFANTLDTTVIRDFEEELEKQNVFGLLKQNKTRRTYEYQGRMVEFFGADDDLKLRGAKRNILYINEGNELDFKTHFFQLLIRTEDDIFIDFNPDDDTIWINTEIEQKRFYEMGDVEVIVSTYKDNTFLPESLIKEIEYLERTDPEFWKIYGLVEYGKIHGLIFPDYVIVDSVPKDAQFIAHWLDWGFSNDPTSFGSVWRFNSELYFDELIYQSGLTNSDIIQRLHELGITKQQEIVADSAEPKSIEDLRRAGFRITPAKKGPDSVVKSIDTLRPLKKNITSRSVNTIKEFRVYRWLVDQTGNSINEPTDSNNHSIDGIRYVALNKLRGQSSGVYHIE